MLRRSLSSIFFVAGGCAAAKEERPLRSVEKGGQWRVRSSLLETSSLTTPRRSPAVVNIDGRSTVVGGCSAPGANEDTVEQWRDGRFTPIESCRDTVARSCAAYCTTSSGRSYVMGGFNGLECLREVTVFDVNGSWSEQKPFPSRLKNGAACALRASEGDDVIVVVGGWDEQRTMRTVYASPSSSSSFSSPEMVALLPRPLEAHAVVTIDDDVIVVIGGYDGVAVTDEVGLIRSNSSPTVSLRRFSVRVEESRLREARENHTAVYLKEIDAIVVAGGWNGHTALSTIELLRVKREGERVFGLERVNTEEVEDEVSDEEDDDEDTAEEEESRRESTAASLSSLVSSPSTRGNESVRGNGRRRRGENRPVRSHALVELTSLDELSLPTNAARSIKYTCIAASRRLLALGTSTGSVYVFARFASRQRANATSGGGRLNAVPLHVYTTKDGALHTVRISPNEQLIAVGGESGRVSVLSLAAGVGGGGAAATAAATTPGSPASALIHSVPGDARRSDRVNCLCWSSDSSLLYAAHASGLVVQHKVGIRRSVFRSSFDNLMRLAGPAVQMEYAAGTTAAAAARLLISTPEATFVHDLQAGKAYQVGQKLRNAPMGACWMRGEGGSATDDFVLAARQNGRIWEASSTGIVYKTHQLRQSAFIPTLDPLSFRPTADAAAPPTLLQQTSIDTEAARTTVHLGTLTPITIDSAPSPLPSDVLSLPSTSSATTSFASTVSSSVSSSTKTTVTREPSTRLICSAVRSTLLIADIDRSQLVVVSDLGYAIRDWAVCGPDVFVLLAGSGSSGSGSVGLRKYTLFPVEKATERLLTRKGTLQAARLVLSVRPPESPVDAPPRDTVAAGWPMPLIEKIQTALAAIKKKESESLRRQLNDLVCGGDRKPSIGEEEITVVSESLSSLAVARTRQVSTSDRYLDRRREEEEAEEGAESEYEDGDGGVIRRERGRRRRGDDDERSRSSPDNLRPLRRPTAASAAKTRAASPRSEEGRRVRREEIKRAKRLLESDSSQTEHHDSLRTLLELGSPPPIQFKHSVTVASVARNLAELARVAPPSITDLLVERRTSAKASSGSKRGGGARVVKSIRPQRPTSGGVGGGSRKSGGGAAGMEEEERNSNVLMVEGTKKSSRSSVVDEGEDSENNVEWRREKRMGGVFLREEGGALTRATAAAPQEAETAADAAAAAAAELLAQNCDRCGLHKSWLAIFLFGAAVHRVSVVVREGAYGRGGVPSTVDEWCDALDGVVGRREERRRACDKCERAMQKAAESVPSTGRFCDGLRPVATRVDAEAMREKVLSLPEEVLRAAVFGVRTERRRGRRNGEIREETEEKENGGGPLTAAAAASPAKAMGEEVENGNGEERGEEKEEEEEGEEGRKWMLMMDARQVLTASLFALGREGLREMITQRAKRHTLEGLSDGDWALLARLVAPRESAGTPIPIQLARTMLKEYGMHKFVSIEGPSPPPATVTTPTPSIRSGYGRRVAPIDGPQSAREPVVVSWPMDTAGVCPMCSLSLAAAVGGCRATTAAAAEGGGEAAAGSNQLACYPCGHAYHAICIGEATRRRQNGGQAGISPVCIVCRVRARRSKAATAA
ncbi:hypothetical protein PENTCL1PPCAC_23478, partial [Pristionchus entomophagus]